MTRTVTALRAVTAGRVAVDLDGEPWRTLPLEAVVRAGLAAGRPLERAQARTLARELRRLDALRVATGALRRRGRSRRELAARLEERGVARRDRERTLATLSSVGLVDDTRFATERARTLADRGSGDALIRADLEARGVAAEAVASALEALEPERERAEVLVARHGRGPRTARRLAARGFDPDLVADLVAHDHAEPLE